MGMRFPAVRRRMEEFRSSKGETVRKIESTLTIGVSISDHSCQRLGAWGAVWNLHRILY